MTMKHSNFIIVEYSLVSFLIYDLSD